MENSTKPTHVTTATSSITSNPASDPLRGAFTSAQVEQIAVVGGTGAAEPIIGLTPGGLPDIFAIATGVTSSVSSKMYEEALLRTLNFTSTTTRGTVLDTLMFNPWSGVCVNPAAVLYASIHQQFTGDINISIEVVGNSTLIGRIAAAYIPSMYGTGANVTPENLFMYEHAIMDLATPGKGTFTMKPTTNTNFIVEKEDGKFYGKLVIIAFTDIANSFGTTMNIPLNIYSKLGNTAMYTGLTFNMLNSAPAEFGIPPRFPTTRNATLITDALEPVYETFDIGTFNSRMPEVGQQRNGWTKNSNSDLDLTQYWGNTTYYGDFGDKQGEQARYMEDPCRSDAPSTTNTYIPHAWKASIIVEGYKGHSQIVYSPTSKYTTTIYQRRGDIASSQKLDMAVHSSYSFGKCTYLPNGKRAEASFIQAFCDKGSSTIYPYTLDWGEFGTSSFGTDPTNYAPLGLLVNKGRVISANAVAPLGYLALRIVDPNVSIPAVQPGIVGESMTYGYEFTEFWLQCQEYLRGNPDVLSLTYTVKYVNGALVADVLINKYGAWVSGTVSKTIYNMFEGELSFTNSSVSRNTKEWVTLRNSPSEYWKSREFAPYGWRRDINRLTPCLKAQMMASIIGGVATGAGSAISGIAERHWMRKMQDTRLANARQIIELSAKAKNELAQKDYERRFSQQVSQAATTQSRMYRYPGSSEEAADASGVNGAWEQEIDLKPALYGGVSMGGRKAIDHTWEQSNLLEALKEERDETPVPHPAPIPPVRGDSRPSFQQGQTDINGRKLPPPTPERSSSLSPNSTGGRKPYIAEKPTQPPENRTHFNVIKTNLGDIHQAESFV